MKHTRKQHLRTLWLCGALHAFTHIYQVALIPLYLLMQNDLQMKSVEGATILVTVMGLSYFLPSYLMGVLADRMSRKKLLTVGLILNGVGFIGISLAPNYPMVLACVIVAGLGGSFYHPAATALVARMFPVGTGKALGLVGIGASAGFFVGPLYSGWRAVSSGSWRTPVLEFGLLGVAAAAVFYWLSEEESLPESETKPSLSAEQLFPTRALLFFFLAASIAFSLRDFAGSGIGSLSSLVLQNANGFSPKLTGLAISGIFLASAVSNPLFGGLSDRGRMRWTSLVLVFAAVMIAILPHLPSRWILPALMIYGFFFMASYPMVEAAIMESVPDAIRGRVFGLFITAGGLFGNLSHWAMGHWVKRLGDRAASPASYYPIFGLLALFVLVSLIGLPCLHRIRKKETAFGLENSVSQPAIGSTQS
ncbi:MAG: MFS transporter [Verrucomicrobiota bacterium]